ncbi:hypothetical protein V8F20_000149 [Naviculisporaceae sp. PSN 640]
MAGKRSRNGQEVDANKRFKPGNSGSNKPKPTLAPVDSTYGQRAAFPGLDEPVDSLSDNDLEYEDMGDALSYLKSVRQEAGAIPNLLVAPKVGPKLPPEFYERGFYGSQAKDLDTGDDRGYYDDGAYIAVPDAESSPNPLTTPDADERNNKKVAEEYCASLMARFAATRRILHEQPPQELVDALPVDHETYVGGFGSRSKTVAIWSRRMRNTDPLPVQIAAMTPKSVFKLIRILMKGKFMTREDGLRDRTSRWLWALLARLPDQGQLDHQGVSWIRELGKRAVFMMADKAYVDALREQVQDDLDASDYEEDDEEGDGYNEEPYTQQAEGEVVEDHSNGNKTPNQLDGRSGEDNGEMDMDIDDGEVSSENDHTPAQDGTTNLETAKARLLAALEGSNNTATEPMQDEEQEELALEDELQTPEGAHATLTMILTVAGEFYGQRDLLEFRNPFPDQ